MLRSASLCLSLLLVSALGRAQDATPSAQTPASPPVSTEKGPQTHLAPVAFDQIKLREGFWSRKLDTNRKVTLEACLAKCEETGRIKNFAIAGGLEKGKHEGALYNDSDVYKVLEGLAYTLAFERDPALEARADLIIDKIASAQQKDGYLDTYYTLVEPDKRWTNIQSGHELYCAGHLFEAAVAYDRATGKKKLLEVAKKLADHIDATFGPGKKLDPCGHPEIELALVKLFKATNEPRYLTLAKFFIDQRGNLKPAKKSDKDKEAKGNADKDKSDTDADDDDAKDEKKDPALAKVNALKRKRPGFGEYAQDHKPLREQTEIVGHAVRAMYLYCGAADVAAETGDNTLLAPLETIWHDVVDKKMYITGGIGSSAKNEGFTKAFDLPNESAYCETCAAIGMALWNQRMMLATGEAKYGDIVEKEIYNGILSGVSSGGDAFFYDNPLESHGDHKRVPWFDCSCCPSNLVRFLPSIPGLVFATKGKSIYVCQYVPCDAVIEIAGTSVHIKMETDWPNSGKVKFTINPDKPVTFALKLRRPGWCETVYYEHDLKEREHSNDFPGGQSGWELYERQYEPNDGCVATFLAPVRREHAAPEVEADKGRVAICRGPMVYALEGIDNQGRALSVALPADAPLPSVDTKADPRLGATRILKGKGLTVDRAATGGRATKPFNLTFIPYYLWANRGPSDMRVWVPETPDLPEIAGEGPAADQNGAHVTSSHCWRGDTLLALNDGKVGAKSNDESIPRLTFWDHTGTQEWTQYDFPAPKKLSSSKVFWYDDTGRGGTSGTRVPVGWRLAWRDGADWKPVNLKSGQTYGVALDGWNAVEFDPVETSAVRLEVDLQRGFSAGVLEWEVH
jgi:DUF1680 family protein